MESITKEENIIEPNTPNLTQKKSHSHKIIYFFLIFSCIFCIIFVVIAGYYLKENKNLKTQEISQNNQVVNNKTPKTTTTDIPNASSSANWKNTTLTFSSFGKDNQDRIISMIIPPNWTISNNDPDEILGYELKSKDNAMIFTIETLLSTVGYPLPENAIEVKKINDNERIIRIYNEESNGFAYYYHIDHLKPDIGEEDVYQDYRMSSGFPIENENGKILLDISFNYLGPEEMKQEALKIADKMISSITVIQGLKF